ncbi:MAG: hypothetical protein M1828_007592 [Chrysothrix sp. TS-e1954]|nr:MAG: hypothetical protein M1828_007592 [Chrysothrix sp. TS-e1954]
MLSGVKTYINNLVSGKSSSYDIGGRDFESGESTFLESYAPVSFIGKGSEGVVWSALPRKVDPEKSLQSQLVVVKFLSVSDREIGMLQLLPHHESLQELIDFEPFLQRWVILPYIAGGTLERVQYTVRYPPAFVLHVMISLIEMMDHLHDSGIVHEDLHAGNILLDKQHRSYKDYPTLKLIDFGKSNWSKDKTENLRDPQTWMRPTDLDGLDNPAKRETWFAKERIWDIQEFASMIHCLNHPDLRHWEATAGHCKCRYGHDEVLTAEEHPDAHLLWCFTKDLGSEARNRNTSMQMSWMFSELKKNVLQELKRLREQMYRPLPRDWDKSLLSDIPSEKALKKILARAPQSDQDWRFSDAGSTALTFVT